jgi:hypothetical protein
LNEVVVAYLKELSWQFHEEAEENHRISIKMAENQAKI